MVAREIIRGLISCKRIVGAARPPCSLPFVLPFAAIVHVPGNGAVMTGKAYQRVRSGPRQFLKLLRRLPCVQRILLHRLHVQVLHPYRRPLRAPAARNMAEGAGCTAVLREGPFAVPRQVVLGTGDPGKGVAGRQEKGRCENCKHRDSHHITSHPFATERFASAAPRTSFLHTGTYAPLPATGPRHRSGPARRC